MKLCSNIKCPTNMDDIEWEDNVNVCPICGDTFSSRNDDMLNEYVELKDDKIESTNVLFFKNLSHINDEVINQPEKEQIPLEEEVHFVKEEVLFVHQTMETIKDEEKNEDEINTEFSDRIKNLNDFIKDGDKKSLLLSDEEEKVNDTSKKEDYKLEKNEMIIGGFIINRYALYLFIIILVLVIILMMIPTNTEYPDITIT